jgi:predicted Co/Zn/Cd cation transporter (cation efflux family)
MFYSIVASTEFITYLVFLIISLAFQKYYNVYTKRKLGEYLGTGETIGINGIVLLLSSNIYMLAVNIAFLIDSFTKSEWALAVIYSIVTVIIGTMAIVKNSRQITKVKVYENGIEFATGDIITGNVNATSNDEYEIRKCITYRYRIVEKAILQQED